MASAVLVAAPPPPRARALRAGNTTRSSQRGGGRTSAICRAKNDKNDDDDDDDDGKNTIVEVCGGKTCRRQGALNTMQFFRQVVDEDKVTVKRVGCLGRCGSGPNVMLLPNELSLGHVNTAAHVARLVERQVRGGEGAELIVRTLALKQEGNVLMESGDAVGPE
jgi:(2Fe-2S) ferredoxin